MSGKYFEGTQTEPGCLLRKRIHMRCDIRSQLSFSGKAGSCESYRKSSATPICKLHLCMRTPTKARSSGRCAVGSTDGGPRGDNMGTDARTLHPAPRPQGRKKVVVEAMAGGGERMIEEHERKQRLREGVRVLDGVR